MGRLVFQAVLAVVVSLPGPALAGSAQRTASPASSEVSVAAGTVIHSFLGGGFESVGKAGVQRGSASALTDSGSSETLFDGDCLLPGYPNPFNPATTIEYRMPAETEIELAVFDVTGRLVKVLARHSVEGCEVYRVVWDGTASSGESLSSGVYLIRLQSADRTELRKLVLLR